MVLQQAEQLSGWTTLFATECISGGGTNTVRWILLGLDILDFTLDLLFATRLMMNTESSGTRPFGILLTVVTCVSVFVTAIKLYGRVDATQGWIIRFLVEDSTTIIIMFNVRGAYNPNVFIDTLNLVLSMTYGMLLLMVSCCIVCTAGLEEEEEDEGDNDDDRGCGFNCSLVCAFVVIAGMVILGILIIDSGGEIAGASEGFWGSWLPWTLYAFVLLLGSITVCVSTTEGFQDSTERVSHLDCCCLNLPRQKDENEPPAAAPQYDVDPAILHQEGEHIILDTEVEDQMDCVTEKFEQTGGPEDDESVDDDDDEEASEGDHDQQLLVKKLEESAVENGNEDSVILEEESEVEVEC